MKYVALILSLSVLAGCIEDNRETVPSNSGSKYKAECIDGIEYWLHRRGNAGYLAVRIDPETLSYVRCNGN
jgi:hypothetical protein